MRTYAVTYNWLRRYVSDNVSRSNSGATQPQDQGDPFFQKWEEEKSHTGKQLC